MSSLYLSAVLKAASPGLQPVASADGPRSAAASGVSLGALALRLGRNCWTLAGVPRTLVCLSLGLLAALVGNGANARELDFAKVGKETLQLSAFASWAEDVSAALTFDQVRSDKGPLTFKETPGGAWTLMSSAGPRPIG